MLYFTATVVANEDVGPNAFVLRLAGCEALVGSKPGQFVMLRGPWGTDPLLARAFSILAVLSDGGAEFLIKAVGKGTALLRQTRPGTALRVLGPLGNSFP
ncbi:MAG: FAD-binding oxidoreductase, partial [Pseudomonadota bacterium]